LLTVIPTDNGTENTQSYCLNFHILVLIRKKPSDVFVAASLKLSTNTLAHTFAQSHAHIVRWVKTVSTFFFQLKHRWKFWFTKICCCQGH